MYYGTHYDAPVGELFLAADEESIIGLWIGNQKYIGTTMPEGIAIDDQNPVLKKGVKWLEDYFAGNKPDPKMLPLAPIGGEFKQTVWELLLEIPYGELTTYGELAKEVAKRMGKEKMSAQAVGGAVGHNPISIIIPCHRVVGAKGNLTGYAGGIEKKVNLLTHEGVDMTKLCFPKAGEKR